MAFLSNNQSLVSFAIIWFVVALLITLLVVIVINAERCSIFSFVLFIVLSLALIGLAIYPFGSMTKQFAEQYKEDSFSRTMMGAVGGTLPSSGILIFVWYVMIGRGKSENPLSRTPLYPLLALLISSIAFGAIITVGNFTLYYILGISLCALGVIGVVIITIINGLPIY